MSVFKTASIARDLDLGQSMGWVAKTQGKSMWRQLAEITALALGPSKIEAQDYYKLALFRATLTPQDRRLFLGQKASSRLNVSLSPPPTGQWQMLANKLLTGYVLNGSGIRSPRNLAFYSELGGVPGLPALSSVAELVHYLQGVDLPIFGKPVDGSLAIGATSFIARTEADLIRLGDGRQVPVETLASQIAQYFGRGYLFQELVRQHPEVEALTGRAVGTLRVVTLWGEDAPKVLYCLHKLPAKGAMIDAHTYSSHALAHVDPATGRMLRVQNTYQMNTRTTQEAPATGAPLTDVTLPMVPEAMAVCETAHRLFPTHGLFGFDVMLSVDGPLISEMNTNPFHSMYQRAADRPVLNADFAPRFAEARAANEARIATRAKSVTRGAEGKRRK